MEVDFEVPAFLESGEKVLAATQLDTWSQLINQMSVTALTKQLALHSSYSKQDDTIVLTLLESKAHLNSETAHQQLQDALSAALQQSIKLMINLAQPINTPYAVQQTINQVRQQHAQQVVNTDQSIVQLRDTFNASIVEQSIKPR
jgi:DNA polymerase-3 subunit gamma/tau